jgi:hypothetical protein
MCFYDNKLKIHVFIFFHLHIVVVVNLKVNPCSYFPFFAMGEIYFDCELYGKDADAMSSFMPIHYLQLKSILLYRSNDP